jgi:hypothetical protein
MEAHGIHPHIVAGPSAANALWVTRERISFAGTDRRNPFLFPAGVAIQCCASRHACSRTDATLFWTCIKIAKALEDFRGEE